MSQPSMLRLGLIDCIATNDLTGSDDLVGVLGPSRFTIGAFEAGTSRDVGIEQPIPPGVTAFTIVESDTFVDDPLVTIDLTKDMDTNRIVGVLTDGARYDIRFFVTSQSDQ